MEIYDIHDAMKEFSQSLVPKSCTMIYPNKMTNSRYKDKIFNIPSITTMRLTDEHMKRLDYVFSKESMMLTIRINLLNTILSSDASNTPIKTGGFKNDNVTIKYKKKEWNIIKEELGEFQTTIHLYCEAVK